MKRRKLPKSQHSLEEFKGETIRDFVVKLTPNKLEIIKLLNDGFYGAGIARRLKISRSYVSRFINELKAQELIQTEWVNPLIRKATSYRLTPELKNYLEQIKDPKADLISSLCVPHRIRYKYKMIFDHKRPVSDTTGRFAAAKLKLKRSWCMKGGLWHHFEYKHPAIGVIGITSHGNSIEVYTADRGTPIRAKCIEDATAQIAMALNETAQRFQSEQAWNNVNFSLGDPELVSSPHYAFSSRLGRTLTDSGQTQQKFMGGIEVDKSLQEKYGDKEIAELETCDLDVATIVDRGLKIAYDIENIVPSLVQNELKSVSEQITGLSAQSEKIDMICNSVQALTQSGLPLQNLYNQLSAVVAAQQTQITNMQNVMLKVVENMGKILDKMGT